MMTTKDWNDEFANGAYIPGSKELPDQWAARAAAYRGSGVRVDVDVPYGKDPRERFDLVWPDDAPKGLVVFIHGGYWMAFDKSFWTDLAEGARAHGWAVCIPNHTLAPVARISAITGQVSRAIAVAAGMVDGPLRITGHSAGGHLATRMICDDTGLSGDVMARVAGVMSISGVHDLRPLMQTQMNGTLRLDVAEAAFESPVLHRPADRVPYCAWVGADERPEFIRQSQLMAQMWEGLDVPTACVLDAGHNHFTVIDGLRDAGSAITARLLGL